MANCNEPKDFVGYDGQGSLNASPPMIGGIEMAKRPAKIIPESASSRPLFSSLDTQVIYCGDNLDKLKEMPDRFVDLIYIDPPFNSNRSYEIFWPEGNQTRSFEDRHASTEAYIDFMRPRCAQLIRILKKTGSFYYHCDWHASHYVKVMLDQICGENNFQNEIIWMRASVKGDVRRKYGSNHDTLFFYGNGGRHCFNPVYGSSEGEAYKGRFRLDDGDGKGPYRLAPLDSPNPRPNLTYEYKGFNPPAKGWRVSRKLMEELDRKGRLVFPKSTEGRIAKKHYLNEQNGPKIGDVWIDIPPLQASAIERIGYPTQKPIPLLERIIRTSSNPDDIVLDAFCGCGTALVAAQNLGRRWIGIDISPTACNVMADRLERDCGLRRDTDFHVVNEEKNEEFLRRIPHFEFENWAVLAIGGVPNAAKVNDWGIDGRIYPASHMPGQSKADGNKFNFMDHWYPVQAKQINQVGRQEIDLFSAAMERARRTKGYFVSFGFSGPALTETRRLREAQGRNIVPITVREILEKADHLAMKLP